MGEGGSIVVQWECRHGFDAAFCPDPDGNLNWQNRQIPENCLTEIHNREALVSVPALRLLRHAYFFLEKSMVVLGLRVRASEVYLIDVQSKTRRAARFLVFRHKRNRPRILVRVWTTPQLLQTRAAAQCDSTHVLPRQPRT